MKKRVVVVSSTGGHFDQAIAVLPAFEGCDVTMVTYDKAVLRNFSHPLVARTHYVWKFSDELGVRILVSLFLNIFQFMRIFLSVKPHLLVSTGSEIAVPAFIAAALCSHARRVFVETSVRIKTFSMTGKALRYLAHRIYVQWPQMAEKFNHPRIVFKGRVY